MRRMNIAYFDISDAKEEHTNAEDIAHQTKSRSTLKVSLVLATMLASHSAPNYVWCPVSELQLVPTFLN